MVTIPISITIAKVIQTSISSSTVIGQVAWSQAATDQWQTQKQRKQHKKTKTKHIQITTHSIQTTTNQ